MTPNSKTPVLSVVVASLDADKTIDVCLSSISTACEGIEHEIIVVDAGQAQLVPQLWAKGIGAATGSIVALTTANFVVTRDWGHTLLQSLAAGFDAIGGPLDLGDDVDLRNSAVFFLRYSAFLSAPSAGTSDADDFAGDNCAYSRSALDAGDWAQEHGFWETEQNALLRSKGLRLGMAPAAKATFIGGVGAGSFAHHRYEHGLLFGRWRVQSRNDSRFRIVAASPLVPFVMAARIAKRVWRYPQWRLRFILSLPFILWFAAFWASGEAVGALRARRNQTNGLLAASS